MNIFFHGLRFGVYNQKIRLEEGFGLFPPTDAQDLAPFSFMEVQIAGENHDTHCGAKQFMSSEGMRLLYVSNIQTDTQLTIIQCSQLIEVTSYFFAYPQTNTIRVYHTVKNIADKAIVLEQANSLSLVGLGEKGLDNTEQLYLYRFTNSWHVECQPRIHSFYELGLFNGNNFRSMKRIAGCNTGSWSSKEELPQAIIEDRASGRFLMFQIENNGSWYWEIGENCGRLYLHLSGPNQHFNQWSKKLHPGESFETVKVAVCQHTSLNGVLGEITKYRRCITRVCEADTNLPTIFNEYMHASWENPTEGNTRIMAPAVAKTGVKYYVIDCGWHNEEDSVYPYVGHWRNSQKRFPSGVKKTIEFLHSLGMKAGLWLEIEAIGNLCEEMLNYYAEDCFFRRNGEKILTMGRHQLDFRHTQVTAFIEKVFSRLIEDYGVDYLKIDYNQCSGPGTECHSDSLGDGLLEHNRAYLSWMQKMMERYPHVIMESCASGGQRMDYATLSIHPVQSTSDQTDYKKYPYIAGNILSAVLPEQAAVWSYPITEDVKPQEVDVERIVINMINSFLGRMHLASRIEKLDVQQLQLIIEGVRYYDSLTESKKQGLPYLPLGFTDFNKTLVAAGFITTDKLYLAVWNLNTTGKQTIVLSDIAVHDVQLGYPSNLETIYSFDTHTITIDFQKPYMARFFELDIKPIA